MRPNGRRTHPQTVSLALAGLALVLVLLGLAFASLRRFEHERALTDHTTQVKEQLWASIRLLADAETGQRGFLLTGEVAYLEPYENAKGEIPQLIQGLADLLRDNALQRARLGELEGLARAKLEELGETIRLEEAGHHDVALAIVRTARGKRTMDEIRGVQASMIQTEDALLAQRNASARLFARLCFAIIVCAAAGLVVVGFLLQSVGRQLAQRELLEARNADLESFAGWLAHDIRSPLETVDLAIETAKRHPNEEKTHIALDAATRTLQRIGTVVEGLLQFASAGAPSAVGEHADVRSIASDVVEAARPVARERGIALEVHCLSAATVACSPGVLTSMISNLVENAIKYIGEAPTKRVVVGAKTRGSTTRVEVRDTGPGVPAAYRGTIFDPHVRAPGSTASGLGLGLATVRRLAEAHGGSVGLVSNIPTGSVFWLELPNAPSASQRERAPRGIADGLRLWDRRYGNG